MACFLLVTFLPLPLFILLSFFSSWVFSTFSFLFFDSFALLFFFN